MVRLGAVAWLGLVLLGLAGPALGQGQTQLLPDTDLPGFDYQTIKNTDAPSCQAACEGDSVCQAFTFNEQAGWCFLKSEAAEQSPFVGALSGLVEHGQSAEALAAVRQAELPFPAQNDVDTARAFAAGLATTDTPPRDAVYADLVAEAEAADAAGDPLRAMLSYRQALALNGNDQAVWQQLAIVALRQADAVAGQAEGDNSYELAALGRDATLNAFLRAQGVAERADALFALAHALEYSERWREAIATYRASVALVDDVERVAQLEAMVAQHGFRVVDTQVDAEAASPRVCAVFSDPLPNDGTDLSSFVSVKGVPTVAVDTEPSQVCVTGLEHGRRYEIALRAGITSADGETLPDAVSLNVFVPDRTPFVAFANAAYVMPAGLGGGLPITAVNAELAEATIYRVSDRSMAAAVREGVFGDTLTPYSAEQVADQYGEQLWEGQVDLAKGAPNALVTTAIPVGDVLNGVRPGAYVITARIPGAEEDYWSQTATQWFIVSDLGLTTVAGEDGVHAFVRSLQTAQAVAGVRLQLLAVNNDVLGEATTGPDGSAVFAPGLARGTGGRAPQLLVAQTDDGDYAFLDVARAPFDLSDRGVEGRPSPGPLDLFATTERGVYRPGETVYLTALLRDGQVDAVRDLPLTLEMERPDGVVAATQVLEDGGAGGYHVELPLVADAMRGAWHLKLYADRNAEPLADVTFLVEDFEPERLAFEVGMAPDAIVPGETTPVEISAKYLYGATAPDLPVEADVLVRPLSQLPEYPGYRFGRLDDTIEPSREPLGQVAVTDDGGKATAELTLPLPGATTRPLEAELALRLVDTNGRPVERTLVRPVLAQADLLGIKPQFDDGSGLSEGAQALFDVIAVAPDGSQVARSGVRWTLSQIDTQYQWYREGSTWKWEGVTTTREVGSGTVDTLADSPVSVGAAVRWGEYRLEVESSGDGASASSYEFYAGYYSPTAGTDTPDTLSVALDKTAYRVGETARLRLDPQFAGTALVLVLDDRLISMEAVAVPEGGAEVSLPVTAEWGPGAYVSAVLYRPADAAEKRMPARALGIAFADVDPGEKLLRPTIAAPDVAAPRESFTATVSLGRELAGETAYVTVAAVDLGILNLTNFNTSDPDGWFFGQWQLGVEIRDLYGSLIDPTQGLAGALRSGGDGGASRLGTPPPTSVLVALHSGIVTVGADGTAEVSFPMPDFAGTVRLMAMAWTDTAVGHAERDVVVRDSVVVNLSPPRFLRIGDDSRLLVEINNLQGPAGAYRVALETGNAIGTDAGEQTVELAEDERTTLQLPLRGLALADQAITLTVTPPEGEPMVKTLTLGVRATSAPRTRRSVLSIAGGETLSIGADRFEGFLPHTGSLTLAFGPLARLDVPSLLLALDRYPYGCAEQVASRALPLLYLNDVAIRLGLGSDGEIGGRVDAAIVDLLAKQTYAGGFGLWGPFSATDLWLDSFVVDFLQRAKAAGHDVPELALTRALDNLANQVSYAADFEDGGEGVAYALYDLARAGRAAVGDLRYYLEARLDAFGSPLAKAQLGAALALYGDPARAQTAFAAAVADLDAGAQNEGYRDDYGSRLRDLAGVIALAAEFAPDGVEVDRLATQLSKLRNAARYTSTQEDSWTLLAAAALGEAAEALPVTVDGVSLEGSVYQRFDQEHFDGADVTIDNTGSAPVEVTVAVTATPDTPPEASSEGFTLTREVFTLDGEPVDAASVSQNTRLLVVLTARPTVLGSGRYLIVDPLPAGFEIENPNLVAGEGASDYGWLVLDTPEHTEARTDQFVAAFRYQADVASVTTAYVVRAVTPGAFTRPGAVVEDMYQPTLRANTEAMQVEVTAP